MKLGARFLDFLAGHKEGVIGFVLGLIAGGFLAVGYFSVTK